MQTAVTLMHKLIRVLDLAPEVGAMQTQDLSKKPAAMLGIFPLQRQLPIRTPTVMVCRGWVQSASVVSIIVYTIYGTHIHGEVCEELVLLSPHKQSRSYEPVAFHQLLPSFSPPPPPTPPGPPLIVGSAICTKLHSALPSLGICHPLGNVVLERSWSSIGA